MKFELDLDDLKIPTKRDYWNVVKLRVYHTKFSNKRNGKSLLIDNANFTLELCEPHKKSVIIFCDLRDDQHFETFEFLEKLVKLHKNKQIWIVTSHRLRSISFSQLFKFPKQINFLLLLDCDPKNRYKIDRIFGKPTWIFFRQNLTIETKESAKPKKRNRVVDDEGAIMSALYRGYGDLFGL